MEGVGAAHADERHLPGVDGLGKGHGRVGVVGPDDGDAPCVDEAVVRLDPGLCGALRKPRVLLEQELVAAVQQAAFDAFVERHADLTLESAPLHSEPADLYRLEPQPPFLDIRAGHQFETSLKAL